MVVRRKWTDARIKKALLPYTVRLRRLPSQAELLSDGESGLMSVMQATGGFLHWAAVLGVPTKQAHEKEQLRSRKKKFCPGCKKTKNLRNFHRNKAKPDGRADACKLCISTSSSNWYQKNKERHKANVLKARAARYEDWKANARVYNKEYRSRNRGTLKGEFMFRLIDARRRSKAQGVPCSLTIEDLIAQYEFQEGRCLISGRTLELMAQIRVRHPDALSIDRIIPSKGYVAGNVRLVIWAVNVAMQNWGEDFYVKLCREVVRHADKDDQKEDARTSSA